MMDAWIVERLEACMDHSTVSPYAVARFFIVGAAFAFTVACWLWSDGWAPYRAFVSVVAVLSLAGDYILTNKAERENSRGFLNRLKRHTVMRTGWLLWLAANLLVLLAVHSAPHIALCVALVFIATYSYFQALNWTPPPPKATWDRTRVPT